MKVAITYADKKTRNNIRTIQVDAPEIKSKHLTLKEAEFIDRMAYDFKKSDEEIMSWKVIEQ